MNKQAIINLFITQLEANIRVAQQAVRVSRDTATHKDCLGSSKYETMGTEASYLAKGQGERLLELQHALAYFKQLKPKTSKSIQLISLVVLEDENGKSQSLLMAADAGGLKVSYDKQIVTVITPQAPLGKSLLGKQEGDDVELNIAGKLTYYDIVNVV
jgi:transcription elongation GreA/GreB family factor